MPLSSLDSERDASCALGRFASSDRVGERGRTALPSTRARRKRREGGSWADPPYFGLRPRTVAVMRTLQIGHFRHSETVCHLTPSGLAVDGLEPPSEPVGPRLFGIRTVRPSTRFSELVGLVAHAPAAGRCPRAGRVPGAPGRARRPPRSGRGRPPRRSRLNRAGFVAIWRERDMPRILHGSPPVIDAIGFTSDQTVAPRRPRRPPSLLRRRLRHARALRGGSVPAESSALRDWCRFGNTDTAYIEPGSPWENPFVESFASRVRDEVLAVEAFDSLPEAKVVIEEWRNTYNHRRPHSSLGWKTPAAYAADRRT